MQTRTAKQLLSRFLSFTETEVLGAFASLARAQKHPEYIYIPGPRKDRILLVAHADTVNDSKYSPKIRWMGDVATLETFWRKSEDKRVYGGHGFVQSWDTSSLGGDDRCGCAMLWALQNLGHSLLITTGEESGLRGARTAARTLKEELAQHAYALEIDRRGDRQAVFYDVGTEAFEDHIIKLLSESDPEGAEWVQEIGSSTDIRAICPEVRICGVNVSAGYTNEHSGTEHVYLEAWLHTHATLSKMLKAEQQPFLLPKVKTTVVVRTQYTPGYRWCGPHGCWSDKCPESQLETCERNKHGATVKGAKGGAETGPFKLQVFRTGGTKAGEGQVTLRAVDVDGKSCPLGKISKRQCKKFGKYISNMIGKGGLDQAEGARILAQAIQLRDGPIPAVTESERAEHASGGTDAFVKGMMKSSPSFRYAHPATAFLNRGGEFVPFLHKSGGQCWHRCGGCKKFWYHERLEGSEDRPTFFCYCPVCSPNVVPRLIVGDGYAPATWGYDSAVGSKAPASIEVAARVPTNSRETGSLGTIRDNSGRSLNEPTVCQHYCARCQAPWRHSKPPLTRSSIICNVGGYDHDCPIHSAHSAKVVCEYEEQLKMKTGWKQTLNTPPPEEPAPVSDPHGAALPGKEDMVIPLGS